MTNIKFIVSLLVLLSFAGVAQERILKPAAGFLFNVDYNRTRCNDTCSYVEVGFSVYPGLVSLKQMSNGFHGAVDIRIAVKNSADGALVSFDRVLIPVDIADTNAAELQAPHVGKSVFALSPATYKLDVLAIDSLVPSRRDSVTALIGVKQYPSSTSLSDVQLCISVVPSTDKTDPFYKNSYRVIENPSRVFSTVGSPVVYSYIELYNLRVGFVYSLKTQVVDAAGAVVRERKRQKQFSFSDAVDVATMNINTVAAGKYRFVYTLADTSGNDIAHSEKPVYVLNSRTRTAGGAISMSVELAGLTSEELQDEFEKAQYLMQPNEIKGFKPLTTAEAKRTFLSKFWSEIQSGAREWKDLTRAIYLQRIARASNRFKSWTHDGWRTDRGRIYALYGEPDEIERFPNTEGKKPHEIWHYNQIEGGVLFYFIDLRGYSEYTLVNSTKRGELHDDNWEQYLSR